MSLTSYRAAPPRVKTLRERLSRARLMEQSWHCLGRACFLAKPALNCSTGAEERRGDWHARRGRHTSRSRGRGGGRRPLAGAARGILHEARDALDDQARPQAAAVHEYRKDMKRWRAMLRLLAPFVGPQGDGLQRQARGLAPGVRSARRAQ